MITPGKEIKWFNAIAKPIKISREELIFNGIFLDITERKLAEQEYMAVERKTRAMSQATHDALIMIDANQKIAFWNPAAEEMFGYHVYEAVGRDFYQLIVPPDQEEQFRMAMDQPMSTEREAVKRTQGIYRPEKGRNNLQRRAGHGHFPGGRPVAHRGHLSRHY